MQSQFSILNPESLPRRSIESEFRKGEEGKHTSRILVSSPNCTTIAPVLYELPLLPLPSWVSLNDQVKMPKLLLVKGQSKDSQSTNAIKK